MDLEIEHDPSSRFVDYTNATPFETLTSVIEDVLRKWNLADKGYTTMSNRFTSLVYEGINYRLRLVSDLSKASDDSDQSRESGGSISATSSETTQNIASWNKGTKQFTPTMLKMSESTDTFRHLSPYRYNSISEKYLCFYRWFGIHQFLMLSRMDDHSDYLGHISTSEASLLLSAICLALGNISCTIPAFVNLEEPSKKAFIGYSVPGASGNVVIKFETDSVPGLSTNQSCISGLLDFFRLKLQLPSELDGDDEDIETGNDHAILANSTKGYQSKPPSNENNNQVDVTASFVYVWKNRISEDQKAFLAWRQSSSVASLTSNTVIDKLRRMSQLSSLQSQSPQYSLLWGPTDDPLLQLHLQTIWPKLREGSYVDNAVHSTLRAEDAPQWNVSPIFCHLSTSDLLLGQRLQNMVNAYCQSKEMRRDTLISELATNHSISGALSNASELPTISKSVDDENQNSLNDSAKRLSESIPAARATSMIGNAIGSLIAQSTMLLGSSNYDIEEMLDELFTEKGDKNLSQEEKSSLEPLSHSLPVGQLVSLLAMQFSAMKGMGSMCLLWVEFVKRLRHNWENLNLLPNMGIEEREEGIPLPNLSSGLLNQKLQMLNVCIDRERKRQHQSTDHALESTSDGMDDEDAFFDSQEEIETSLLTRKETGVRCRLPHLMSLSSKKELNEPIVQEPLPLTEDIVYQHQEILSRLKETDDFAQVKQQLQRTSLLSDMQAFKAANPGCCMADFIRWHSPKDWISWEKLSSEEKEQSFMIQTKESNDHQSLQWNWPEYGRLSQRMGNSSCSSNLWKQTWLEALSICVQDQRPLFNPTHEAEKVFHFLETLAPFEMFHHILVGTITNAIYILKYGSIEPISKIALIDSALPLLSVSCNKAIDALDETSRTVHGYLEIPVADKKVQDYIQVAFAMTIEVMEKLVQDVCDVEATVAFASSSLRIFPTQYNLINRMLLQYRINHAVADTSCAVEDPDERREIQYLFGQYQQEEERDGHQEETLKDSTRALTTAAPLQDPIRREYILSCIVPRPFNYATSSRQEGATSASVDDGEFVHCQKVVNRLYAEFDKDTVRFGLAESESDF